MATDKTNQPKDQSQSSGLAKKDNQQLNVKPLPQNRPIASNVTEETEEMMGYLD